MTFFSQTFVLRPRVKVDLTPPTPLPTFWSCSIDAAWMTQNAVTCLRSWTNVPLNYCQNLWWHRVHCCWASPHWKQQLTITPQHPSTFWSHLVSARELRAWPLHSLQMGSAECKCQKFSTSYLPFENFPRKLCFDASQSASKARSI